MSWPKRILAVVFVLLVAGVVVASLQPKKEKPVEVSMTAVKRGPITRTVTAAGKLQAATEVKVSSNLSGDLLELEVKEGDRVKKGQLLARIDARRYTAQVRQSEAARASAVAQLSVATVDLDRLKQERERVRRLVEAKSASQAELERSDSDVAGQEARAQAVREQIAQASAALSEANHLLSMTTLYAPIDGVVTSAPKKVGERVRGSDFTEDVILVISTLSQMEVKVEVGEHEVVYLHEGDKAEVEVDAFPDQKWPAQVIEISKNANIKNQGTEAEVTTFFVRLGLAVPVPGGLPGMSAEVDVASETKQDALVVPIQAVAARTERELHPDGKGAGAGAVVEGQVPRVGTGKKKASRELRKVLFVVEDGVARARRVETGLASENEIEITEGVEEGEVIIEGPYKAVSRELSDGKPVKPADKDDGKGKGKGKRT